MTGVPTADRRLEDIRVARIHLRLGQLTLARAELEDLLRRDALDGESMAALAEARWRTGDGAGAAEAALAHLEAGGSDDVALCIAAEAVAAEGRTSDARALMDRLPASDAATLDALFAGMPRRAFWPAGPVDRSHVEELQRGAGGRAGALRRQSAAVRFRDAQPAPGGGGEQRADLPSEARTVPGPQAVLEAMSGAGWAAASRSAETQVLHPEPAQAAARRGRRMKGQLDPAAEMARARQELEARPDRALLRLSLVLRHDPTFAPAVLDLLRLRRDPLSALVRGDAQRLLGRHLEAEAAFDAAAESLEVS